MLYGMDDNDYAEEFGLVKTHKLNVNKVVIVFAIIIGAILIIFISFKISSAFIKNKNATEEIAKEENSSIIIEQEENDTTQKSTSNSKNDKKTTKSDENAYTGNHLQIAAHDVEKIKTKFVPQANENAQELIKEIYKSDEKQVYLTFDDGPSKDITPQILDVLKEYDVKATFFVLGARVELYPDTLKREYEEGHYIANHGYSHEYSKVYESKDTVFQEYIDCENAIKNALDNQDYNSYLFRFPGGSSGGKYSSIKSEATELFKEYGVAYTNWNCLTGDAEGSDTKEAAIQEMLETKGEHNSIILLMHDANDKTQTLEALPEIIQYFKDEGYTFKTFYEIFS